MLEGSTRTESRIAVTASITCRRRRATRSHRSRAHSVFIARSLMVEQPHHDHARQPHQRH